MKELQCFHEMLVLLGKDDNVIHIFAIDTTELMNTQKELREAKAKTPDLINAHIRKLERELFHTWAFIMEEGLYSEALEYVNEHKDEETPLEW